MKLMLASTSPYRRELLARLKLPFECISPRVDEEAYKVRENDPLVLAETLARAKAESIAMEHPDAIVIGSDQIAECDGLRLDKPKTVERAIEQLALLAGRTHRLITALCVVARGSPHLHVDVATLRMKPLDRPTIERYIFADMPLDCAGSYKLESLGIALFESIDCADHSAITGLPLLALCGMLNELGFTLP